ncbi:Uncharacterised protein [Cronobacter sakazakii]|nr:Uncharacterised protein [Cronobacter sakazakii]
MDAWTLLGLEPTKDKGALRRAWAKIVKQHRPDQDPQKYQQLREAYEAAQRYQAYDDEEEGEEADDEGAITYPLYAANIVNAAGMSLCRRLKP